MLVNIIVAIIQSGLKPKFVDVEKLTLNVDLKDLRKKFLKNKRYHVSSCAR